MQNTSTQWDAWMKAWQNFNACSSLTPAAKNYLMRSITDANLTKSFKCGGPMWSVMPGVRLLMRTLEWRTSDRACIRKPSMNGQNSLLNCDTTSWRMVFDVDMQTLGSRAPSGSSLRD